MYLGLGDDVNNCGYLTTRKTGWFSNNDAVIFPAEDKATVNDVTRRSFITFVSYSSFAGVICLTPNDVNSKSTPLRHKGIEP